MAQKTEKLVSKRKKFIKVDIPLINSQIDLIATSPNELENKTIKLDLTRQLKGKSVEAIVRVKLDKEKLIAEPYKIRLMPYFIRRMIRKRISYVEDSFLAKSQESMLLVKPFLITRKRVSRVIRKTLRNKTKNWIEDYMAERTDKEIFNEILLNKMQKPLSLSLKKTYPLSLCEIRILEIKRPLKKEEIPKVKKKETTKEPVLDQLQELEQEKIKLAETEMKETQKKASEKEEAEKIDLKKELKEAKEKINKKKKSTETKTAKTKVTKTTKPKEKVEKKETKKTKEAKKK